MPFNDIDSTRKPTLFLLTGEVPGLHSQEELEPLLAPLKEQMREDGNHKTTFDFFVSRVQKNLHVALCMVSVGIRRRRVRAPRS